MVDVSATAWDEMVRHAHVAYPLECCGLLLGTADGRTVYRAWPAHNDAESETRFLVRPADHFAAIREARRTDLAVVGAYHSHPRSPAEPSATDLSEALQEERWLHVIVSFSSGCVDVKGYHYGASRPSMVLLCRVPDLAG